MTEEDLSNPALEEAKAQHLAALSLHVLKTSATYSAELMRAAENAVGGNVDSSLQLVCTLCGHSIDLSSIEVVSPGPRVSTRISLGRRITHKHPRPDYALLHCTTCGKSVRLIQEKEKLVCNPTNGTTALFAASSGAGRPANKLSSILSRKSHNPSSQSTSLGSATMNQFGLSITDFIH
ncbi:Hypothetical protein GLP15_2800 [Giardia lamblia P15]|uniref:Uncharacterized protein n=1 Tax=Giardia intestinalis (strain P15) TaxID=658858 RepID=E1F455_GIAIA|nr:Hypothetical protein GLP15_2800 [Giardia lamblia P15]